MDRATRGPYMKLSSQRYALGIGAVVVMSLLFAILYLYTGKRIEAAASVRINALARHTADTVQSWLSSQTRTLKVIAAFLRADQDSDKPLSEVAGLAALRSLDICLVLQQEGKQASLYTKGRRQDIQPDTKDTAAWKTFLARATEEGRLEAPLRCLADADLTVSAALPLLEENGRRFGVLAISIPLSSLAKTLLTARALLSNDRLFFLVNEKGQILASSQEDEGFRAIANDPELRVLPLMTSAWNDDPLRIDFQGREYLAAGVEVNGTGGWRFYLLSPLSEELELLPMISFALAGAWLCLCFFVFLVLYQLRRHAHYKVLSEMDHLTGAGNRLAFELALSRLEKVQEFPVCLIVVDVDGLKHYNDRLGHDAGDLLLRSVMLVLQRSLRENDAIFRIGGDEFAVIIAGATYSMAEPLITRISMQAAQMREKTNQPPVYISCGMAEASDETGLATLFVRADEAMYANKNSRREMVNREIVKWIEDHPDLEERRATRRDAQDPDMP